MKRVIHGWSQQSPRQQAVWWGLLAAGVPILVGELLLRILGKLCNAFATLER